MCMGFETSFAKCRHGVTIILVCPWGEIRKHSVRNHTTHIRLLRLDHVLTQYVVLSIMPPCKMLLTFHELMKGYVSVYKLEFLDFPINDRGHLLLATCSYFLNIYNI